MRVLGIETSCDETGLAIYDSDQGLLAHAIHSQVKLHEVYGGVVPELASRDHIQRILPLLKSVLSDANLRIEDIGAIAYTAGPGLVGALLVGAAVGRSLAYGLGIPAVAVHHMEAHLLAPMLEDKAPEFPFLALLVSGGHTQLVQVNQPGDYELLGESVDDAVGEAFDKTANLLGLGYPGGAALSLLAEHGNPDRFSFPRPMIDRPGLDFSFSGLKTHVVNTFQQAGDDPQTKADIARAFVDAVVDTLVIKCRRTIEQTQLTTLIAAGGVSANKQLRSALVNLAQEVSGQVFFPRLEFCTDNGAMIAYAGYMNLIKDKYAPLTINAKPRWPLTELD